MGESEKDAGRELTDSMEKLSQLDKKRLSGEISQECYDLELERIQARFKSETRFKDKYGSIRPESGYPAHDILSSNSSSETGIPYRPLIFLAALFLLIIYALTNMHCVSVGISFDTLRMNSLLSMMKSDTPEYYDFVCDHLAKVSSYWMRVGYYTVDNIHDRERRSVSLTNSLLDRNMKYAAGVLVHETCHGMQIDIMEGKFGLTQEEVERPCVRMQYMYLYKSGYYSSYARMLDALDNRGYGRDYTLFSVPDPLKPYMGDKYYRGEKSVKYYCDSSSLEAERTRSCDLQGQCLEDIIIRNSGGTRIHCGLLDFRVDGREYPLGCWLLEPGQSYKTGENFRISADSRVSVWVTGCDDTLVTP